MTKTYKREFIHDFRDAIEAARIPKDYKLLLFMLANHAKGNGSNTYPSQARLAIACGCSERTVRAHLAHLQEAGWLTVTERGTSGEGRGGKRRANVYQLCLGRDFAFAQGAVRFPPSGDVPVIPKVRPVIVPKPEPRYVEKTLNFGVKLDLDAVVDF